MKTASRTKFFIEFYSTCLEGQRRAEAGCGQEGWGARGAQSSQPLGWGKGSHQVALSWLSPTLSPEYKKSFENDAQSSDNINFLKVQWSSRQLPTVRLLAGPGPVGEGTRRGVAESMWLVLVRVCVCVCGGAGHE